MNVANALSFIAMYDYPMIKEVQHLIENLDGKREYVSYREHHGIRIYLNHVPENYPPHWHTASEIILPLVSDYKVVVGGTAHTLAPGDIFIIPSGELHELYAPPSGERMIVQFDTSLLYSLSGLESAVHLLRPCALITERQHGDLHTRLHAILLELQTEYFGNALFREASAYSTLIRFLVTLGRSRVQGVGSLHPAPGPKQHRYIEKLLEVCNHMNDHCTEAITVEELAAIAGFSKFHFIRLFKQFMGMSYYSYLNERRIMVAEKLLADPHLSVTEVAMRSGFASLATFYRVFKACKRCTPSEYKSLQGNHTR